MLGYRVAGVSEFLVPMWIGASFVFIIAWLVLAFLFRNIRSSLWLLLLFVTLSSTIAVLPRATDWPEDSYRTVQPDANRQTFIEYIKGVVK